VGLHPTPTQSSSLCIATTRYRSNKWRCFRVPVKAIPQGSGQPCRCPQSGPTLHGRAGSVDFFTKLFRHGGKECRTSPRRHMFEPFRRVVAMLTQTLLFCTQSGVQGRQAPGGGPGFGDRAAARPLPNGVWGSAPHLRAGKSSEYAITRKKDIYCFFFSCL